MSGKPCLCLLHDVRLSLARTVVLGFLGGEEWGGGGGGRGGYQHTVQYVSCFNPNLSRSLHGKHPPYSVDLRIYPHL